MTPLKESVKEPHKTSFKLFDFFANCEYFEEDFDYDEVIKLPKPKSKTGREGRGRSHVETAARMSISATTSSPVRSRTEGRP
jgi:hypothetical protein